MDVGLVCDGCHAFNPMGASACARCGAAIALEPPRSRLQAAQAGVPPAPTTPGAAQACPTCKSLVAPGHKFCFNCGSRMPDASNAFAAPLEETQFRASPIASASAAHHAVDAPHLGGDSGKGRSTAFFGAMQVARAKLTLIRGDGLDGVSFTLAGDEHYAGRIDCPLLFPDDPYLAPVHANFFYRDGNLVVRDEQTLNGIYLRIAGTVPLAPGTRFLVGEQVLELSYPPAPVEDAEPDGTYFYASPRRPAVLRVAQLLRGGSTGLVIHTATDSAVIGREGNDINFPDDPFISGRHAQVQLTAAGPTLTDLGSRNGTFVRIVGEQVLRHGDYVFMGQQLLRVEIV